MGPSNLCFNKHYRSLWCTLKFENHSSPNFNVHKNHLGSLLNCRFKYNRSEVGPESLHFKQVPRWCLLQTTLQVFPKPAVYQKSPRLLIKSEYPGTTPDQINRNRRRKASSNTISGSPPQLHIKITRRVFNTPDAGPIQDQSNQNL